MADDNQEQPHGDASIERSVEIDADPQTVWEHLTSGEMMSTWLGSDVTFEPRRGGAILVTDDDAGDVFGVVEDFIPGRRIQWSWRTRDGLPALVEIEIEPTEDATRLTVRETLIPWQVTEVPHQYRASGRRLGPFGNHPQATALASNAA